MDRKAMLFVLVAFAPLAGAGELVGPPAPAKYTDTQAHYQRPSRTQTDIAWMAGAAALDLGTTEYALRRCGTCREGNPLLANRGARLALKLGATAGLSVLCHHLHKTGRHKAARTVRWITVATWVAASVATWVAASVVNVSVSR